MSDSTKFILIEEADERRINRKQLGMVAIGGLMAGLAFPPFPLNFLMFFAFIPLFQVIEKRESFSAINRATYLFAFVMSVVSLYWVGSWTPEADPFLKISGVMLIFFNPIFFLIPSTVYYMARKVVGKRVALVLFPLIWVFFEYIYTVTEFRFPWLTLANSQTDFHPFIQIADIIGAYGISLVIVFINLAIYLALISDKKSAVKPAILAVFLFVVVLGYGFVYNGPDETNALKIRAGIVQPNLNPWNKWDAGNLNEQLKIYLDLSQKCVDNGAKIVVWPETALPVYLMNGRYNDKAARIRKFVNENDVVILTGMPDATFYTKNDSIPDEAKPLKNNGVYTHYTSYNSVLLFEPGKIQPQKYGKMLLVPFGEKVPYVEVIPFLGKLLKWEVGISSWNIGKEHVVFNTTAGKRKVSIAGSICIESIYPDFNARFVQKGAQLLAVVTNDSWYGYSSGPFQHKEIAKLRAVENRRNIIRCANGGISCFVDASGRTHQETNLFRREWITGDVSLLNTQTFYTQFPLLIPGIATIISSLIIILFILGFFRKKNAEDN